MHVRVQLIALFATLCGCADGLVPLPFCDAPQPLPADPPTPNPYTWVDVEPIVVNRCAGCHEPGGIAPFVLQSYEDVAGRLDAVHEAIHEREMPPWPPDPCCAEYRFDRSLTESETTIFLSWLDGGAPRGTGTATITAPPIVGLSRVDVEVPMPIPYTPKPRFGTDDLRCFLADWPYETTKYVRGLDVVPGDRSTVHHVIAYVVNGNDLDHFEGMDEDDDEPGWNCYGGVGSRSEGALGGWAPGSFGVDYPDGVGRKIEPGSKILINVHYEVLVPTPGPDQTTLRFAVSDDAEREGEAVVVFHPQWLVGDGLSIPAGESDVRYAFSYDPSNLYDGRSLRLHNANLHMHELGTRGTLAILRDDGTKQCLLSIFDWSFEWQGDYWFTDPPLLEPGDELYVECHFDNTIDNQRVIDGVRQTPKDQSWGNDQEMCIGFFFVSRE